MVCAPSRRGRRKADCKKGVAVQQSGLRRDVEIANAERLARIEPATALRVMTLRLHSKEVQPVHVRLLCRLQLRDSHAYEGDGVLSIDRDYGTRLGVMRLTQHLCGSVVLEQDMTERKHVLI